jgi:hypothetical protein
MKLMFRVAVRLEVSREARDLDLSFSERRSLLKNVMDEASLKMAADKFGGVPVEYLVDDVEAVAFGDGSLLRAILDWLSSEEGRAFIKFLIGLFMAL